MAKRSKEPSLIIPELPGFEGMMKVDLFSDKGDALDETGLQPLPDALPITVRRLHTSSDLEAVLSDILSARLIGLDLETTGLDPKVHKMRLAQIAVGQTVYVIDLWEMDPQCLQIILRQAKNIAGQNLAFDLGFLAEAGLEIPNGDRLWDTMLLAQILEAGSDTGYRQKCKLKHLVARYMGLLVNKELQTSNWANPHLTDAQIQYAAYDAAVVLPLAKILADKLKEAALMTTCKIEHRCLPALVWMKGAGIKLNTEKWLQIEQDNVIERSNIVRQMNAMAGTNAVASTVCNWNSPQQVRRIFEARIGPIESTREAALVQIAANGEPLAQLMVKYRHLSKRIGTYGSDYLDFVHPVTGLIYPGIMQLGAAATGRVSYIDPNWQQIPREKRYRQCVEVEDGFWLVKADYSQIELRAGAVISGDHRLRQAYLQGDDVHTLTAQTVLGISDVGPDDRQKAKAVNFGFLFGMGAPKFKVYAFSDYGVLFSDQEALRFRKKFFDLYPGIRAWHRRQSRFMVDTRTLTGRRRLHVDRFSEKLNTPVQGSAADGTKLALAYLWETRHEAPYARPLFTVHDEIVIKAQDGHQEQAEYWLRTTMERAMEQAVPGIPILAETKISKTWG
jgi:DNA polymerase-1